MELNMLYVHSNSIGYGRMGTEVAKALTRLGVDVYDHLPEPGSTEPQRDLEHLAHLNTGKQSKICGTVCWLSVPTHCRGWYKGQTPIIWCMWESRTLPPSFRETLHEFDTVVVPSLQNVELFSQYHPKVRMVLLGVDPDVWKPTPRRPPGQTFNFLIAGSGPRKGTDLAHRAFRAVFPNPKSWGNGPIPTLTMKNPRGEAFHGERVQVIAGRMSAADEVALYETAHCYVQPSRGEGFGLQPLQAMAQGIPTILTDAHGHEAFAGLGHGISSKPSQAAYFIYGDAGEWWEPDFDELCDRMRWIYDHYDEAVADAAISAQRIAENWTWKQTAENLIRVIGPGQLERDCEDLEWHQPVLQKFQVVTNRDWSCEIAGNHLQFTRGEVQWCVADVKRILWEAGLLDPVCLLGPDVGLLPQQLERLPSYLEQHRHCALCGQELGTRETRADKLYAEMAQNA